MSENTIPVGKMLIDKSQLEYLLTEIEAYKKESEDLRKVAYGVCAILGLTDENNQVKTEFLTGTESVMPSVLKAILNTASLLGQAQVPVLGKKAEAEIAKKFEFIKYLIPIIEKYQK
jgi:hypothetical protein